MKSAFVCVLLVLQIAVSATAQEPASTTPQLMSSSLGLHAFPATNQTREQQQQDEMGCYNWAKQDSGFDPVAAFTAQQQAVQPQAATLAKPQTQGAAVKGAAGGAATGAVVGAIAGECRQGCSSGCGCRHGWSPRKSAPGREASTVASSAAATATSAAAGPSKGADAAEARWLQERFQRLYGG
jgi:hypothetical protein